MAHIGAICLDFTMRKELLRAEPRLSVQYHFREGTKHAASRDEALLSLYTFSHFALADWASTLALRPRTKSVNYSHLLSHSRFRRWESYTWKKTLTNEYGVEP